MPHPSDISIEDYTYELPEGRIARYPLSERDQSKLLVYRNREIDQKSFVDLPDLLKAGDCLVFNDTRVVHARIQFQRATGARIEVFCLEPVDPLEVSKAFEQTGSCTWRALVGNAKKWKDGEILVRTIRYDGGEYELKVERSSREADAYIVRFSWDSELPFASVLEQAGTLPIPPYLNRDTEAEDEERYQTVYAQADGSVAAPTAGLHFTKRVFDQLGQRDVNSLFVTLHVGAGTFKPVKSETMAGHEMHKERIHVSVHAIERIRDAASNGRIIPVGTTSLRTIESIYWFGVKLSLQPDLSEFFVDQWDPYELAKSGLSTYESLTAVLAWMKNHNHAYLSGYTQLLIAPGYQIRMADALITNFHQPRSTLLLLVAAFIGDDWRRVYEHALENDFRFLSYGDSSILFRKNE